MFYVFCAKLFGIDTNYQFFENQFANTQKRTKYKCIIHFCPKSTMIKKVFLDTSLDYQLYGGCMHNFKL